LNREIKKFCNEYKEFRQPLPSNIGQELWGKHKRFRFESNFVFQKVGTILHSVSAIRILVCVVFSDLKKQATACY